MLASKKESQCPREVSKEAGKYWGHCAEKVWRVASKNGVIVLMNCPGWQPKMASVFMRIVEGVTQERE
jgi:hypothetical protein